MIHWRLLGPKSLPHFSEVNSKSFWWSPIDHISLDKLCDHPHPWSQTPSGASRSLRRQGAKTQMLKSQTVMMNDVVFRNLQRRAGTTSMEYFHGLLRSEIRRWVKRRVLTSRTSNADRWGVWKEIESTSADLHNCLTFQQTIRDVKRSIEEQCFGIVWVSKTPSFSGRRSHRISWASSRMDINPCECIAAE